MNEIPDGIRLYPTASSQGSVLTYYRFRCDESHQIQLSHGRLLLLLNLQGNLGISSGDKELRLESGHSGLVASAHPVELNLEPGNHQLISLVVERNRLKAFLDSRGQAAPKSVKLWLTKSSPSLGPLSTGPLSRFDMENIEQLIYPPVATSCLDLWYHGKVIELLCSIAFSTDEQQIFRSSIERVWDDRIQKAAGYMRKHFAEAVTLEALAKEVGCSASYLSRRFKEETGKTILTYLREIRILEAADYLKRGTHNVTEAAYDVGYSSLGQFSNAFSRVMGISPQKYQLQHRSNLQQTPDL
ncbi:MAG: AraC family transcriptional regulator [Verrucomicrobiota bacterium]